MKEESRFPRKCNGGWWEIFDPIDGIYHMYGSRQKAIAAKKQIEQKAKADKW